jgi:hypothetical protein
MRLAYSPANSLEAHMLVHLLSQSGVSAHVHGDALQGAAGELPASGLLRLMVDDEDYDRARSVLLAWEREQGGAPTPAESDRWQFAWVTALCFLAVGLLAGWALKHYLATPGALLAGPVVELDQNGDGKADVVYRYPLGGAFANVVELDNNFDGRMDVKTYYDESGTPTREEADNDFDGRFESRSGFRSGVRQTLETDDNGDGVIDLVWRYAHGVLVSEDIMDASGRLVRTNYFEGSLVMRSEIDMDRDGFLETRRRFDRFGEIVASEVIARP